MTKIVTDAEKEATHGRFIGSRGQYGCHGFHILHIFFFIQKHSEHG